MRLRRLALWFPRRPVHYYTVLRWWFKTHFLSQKIVTLLTLGTCLCLLLVLKTVNLSICVKKNNTRFTEIWKDRDKWAWKKWVNEQIYIVNNKRSSQSCSRYTSLTISGYLRVVQDERRQKSSVKLREGREKLRIEIESLQENKCKPQYTESGRPATEIVGKKEQSRPDSRDLSPRNYC